LCAISGRKSLCIMLYTWARSDMMRADMQMKDADVGAQMWVRRCGCGCGV